MLLFILQENCVSLSLPSALRSCLTELCSQERWISTRKVERDEQSESTVTWRPMEAAGRCEKVLLFALRKWQHGFGFYTTMWCVFTGVPEEDEWKDRFLQNLECRLYSSKFKFLFLPHTKAVISLDSSTSFGTSVCSVMREVRCCCKSLGRLMMQDSSKGKMARWVTVRAQSNESCTGLCP